MNGYSSIDFNSSKPFEGTIIRVPLRTTRQAGTSNIVNRSISFQEIEKSFGDFFSELKNGGLIFLRHVNEVVFRLDREIIYKVIAEGSQDTKRSASTLLNNKRD